MGILSNLGNAIKKTAATVVSSPIGKALDVAATAFVHPIQTVAAIVSPNKTVNDLVKEQKAKPLSKQITETALTTAGYGATVVSLGAATVAAKAGTLVPSAVKAVSSLSTKQKVIAAVATPVVVGAVVSQPTKTLQAVAQTPSALANVGANIANLAADPSISNVKTLVTENPVIVGSAIAGAAALGVKGIVTAAATVSQTAAIKEQTKAIEQATSSVIKEPVVLEKTTPALTTATTNAAPITPVTAKTEPIYATTGTTATTRKRKKSKPKVQSISQRTNIILQNRFSNVTNRKYLKRELLYN